MLKLKQESPLHFFSKTLYPHFQKQNRLRMFGDQEPSNPFIGIPEEIRALIWNKLPQDSALNLRNVCRDLRHDIDKDYDHHLQLDDLDHDAISWMTGLRIKHVEIFRLQDVQMFPLKYPNIVKTVHVGTNGIYAENLCPLMTQTASSVEKITIHSNVIKVDFSAVESNSVNIMNQLRTLDANDGYIDDPYTMRDSELTVDGIFLNFIIADKLETFKINVTNEASSLIQKELTSVWVIAILNFIANHPSVSNLDVRLFDSCELLKPVGDCLPDNQREKLKKVIGLKKIKMELKLSKLMTKEFYKLLLQQRGITNLELINDFNTSYLPVGIDRKIIQMNLDYLTKLKIEGFGYEGQDSSGKRRHFDVGIFANCQNLTTLTISRNIHEPQRSHPLEPELVNFHLLSGGIVELDVCDFLVHTSDMLIFCQNVGKKNMLNSFSFRSWAGNDLNFGIDLECMEMLMTCHKFIHVLISNVRFPSSVDKEIIKKRVKLLPIPLRYRESGNDLYIFRETVQQPWKDYSNGQGDEEYNNN